MKFYITKIRVDQSLIIVLLLILSLRRFLWQLRTANHANPLLHKHTEDSRSVWRTSQVH